MEFIVDAVVEILHGSGMEAASSYSSKPAIRRKTPVVAVGIKSAGAVSRGYFDYLGLRLDEADMRYKELYGRQLGLVLSVDLFSPATEGCGAPKCREMFGQIVDAFSSSLPSGLKAGPISCGNLSFDKELNLFHLPCTVEAQAFIYATVDDGGEFTDFVLKGVMKNGDGL